MLYCGFGPDVMKQTKVCRICGCSCDAGETYCEECGAVLPKETLFDLYRSQHLSCPACDTVVANEACFCPKCGKQLWREVVLPPAVIHEEETVNRAGEKPQGKFSHILQPFAARRSYQRNTQR